MGILRRSFSELLKEYRLAAELSQEELAERARLSVDTISALERGRRQKPYRPTIARLAAALQLSAIARAELEMAASRPRGSSVAAGARSDPGLQVASLIGRENDIAGIAALLEENRLVTITGSGGVGKTRVALEVARLSTERWEDIRFVDFSSLSDGRSSPALSSRPRPAMRTAAPTLWRPRSTGATRCSSSTTASISLPR